MGLKLLPLADLIARAGLPKDTAAVSDVAITGITADSRAVRSGMMFSAIAGTRVDGTGFIGQAVAQGAAAVLAASGTGWPAGVPKIPFILHAEPRQALARIAAVLAGPGPRTMVAVTGTNGKTSTVDFLRQMWAHFNIPAASLGTLGLVAPGHAGGGGLTTPDPVALAETLNSLARKGVTHAAMEASSHGLDQYRLDGVDLTAAGFSNLTRDHLDYHQTMGDYRAAKLRLFAKLLPAQTAAVVNADMDGDTLAELRKIAQARHLRLISTGDAGEHWRILATTALPHGQVLQVSVHGVPHHIELALPGRFQADNVLLAAALAEVTGSANVIAALPHLRGVRGRMELAVRLANGAAAYVDYAHTPDALQRLLQALRPHTTGKLVCVFGAGGDRDPGKRPLMGAVVAKYADLAIITDDNPRTENAAAIRAAILSACSGAYEIGDRAAAIAAGLAALRAGDVLVVAGKGHEQGQSVGGDVLAFDDASVLRTLSGAA